MGIFRLLLALSVLLAHCRGSWWGFTGIGATVAVTCFYTVSGFYMAMVINEKYREQRWAFFRSRFLRLYPAFVVGQILGLTAFIVLGILPSYVALLQTIALPHAALVVFSNLSMVGLDLGFFHCISGPNRCMPPLALNLNLPSWTISVEIWFYCCAPWLVTSLRRVLAYLLLGLVYLAGVALLPLPLTGIPGVVPIQDIGILNYYFIPASFVYFAVGALSYHLIYQPLTQQRRITWPVYLAAALFGALGGWLPLHLPAWQLALLFLLLPRLFLLTRNQRIDRFIGELSYPLYMVHFPIYLLLKNSVRPSELATQVAILAMAAAVIIHLLLDRPLQRWRQPPPLQGPKPA